MDKYKEHGTEHEKITAWQKILILLSEYKSIPSKTKFHLEKHYAILNADWSQVFYIISKDKNKNITDNIFRLNTTFAISVNKCNCWSNIIMDTNGMCDKCGLKIKQ